MSVHMDATNTGVQAPPGQTGRDQPAPRRLSAAGDAAVQENRDAPLRVGVIGYGYWGPNLARNFDQVDGAELVAVSDTSPDRLRLALSRHPRISATTDYQDLLLDPTIGAIVVATPVSTHFRLGIETLAAGKHLLMSKPMVDNVENGERLISLAEERGLTLMVDHTFVYTGVVRKIKELVDRGTLGRLQYYDSVRTNLGLFQPDVSVVWDLAVHDLAIMDYLVGNMPVAVSAAGVSHLQGHPVNTAYLTCFFADNLIAHHHVSWLAPLKARRTLIGGHLQMAVYDDIEPSEKLKIYDKGLVVDDSPEGMREVLVGYRTGDMWAPKVPLTEGLQVEAQHFLECVRTRTRPVTDGYSALRVVRVLEAAQESLRQRGRPVDVSPVHPHGSRAIVAEVELQGHVAS